MINEVGLSTEFESFDYDVPKIDIVNRTDDIVIYSPITSRLSWLRRPDYIKLTIPHTYLHKYKEVWDLMKKTDVNSVHWHETNLDFVLFSKSAELGLCAYEPPFRIYFIDIQIDEYGDLGGKIPLPEFDTDLQFSLLSVDEFTY